MAKLAHLVGIRPRPADALFRAALAELDAANAAHVENELTTDYGRMPTPEEDARDAATSARESAARRRLLALLDVFGEVGPVVDRSRNPFFVAERHNFPRTHGDYAPMRSYRCGDALVMAVADNGDVLPFEPLTRLLDGKGDFRVSLIVARL